MIIMENKIFSYLYGQRPMKTFTNVGMDTFTNLGMDNLATTYLIYGLLDLWWSEKLELLKY